MIRTRPGAGWVWLALVCGLGALTVSAQSDHTRTRQIRTIDSSLPVTSPASTAKPSPVRSIDSESWFPDAISVIHTNFSLYYVPDPRATRSSSKNWQRILKGGHLRIRKGDASSNERTFVVQSLTTNAVVLGIQGTLQQKRVPLLYPEP